VVLLEEARDRMGVKQIELDEAVEERLAGSRESQSGAGRRRDRHHMRPLRLGGGRSQRTVHRGGVRHGARAPTTKGPRRTFGGPCREARNLRKDRTVFWSGQKEIGRSSNRPR